jgi:ankyrin repeat protein
MLKSPDRNGHKSRGTASSYRLNRALLDAVTDGEIDVAKELLGQGANVNFRNRAGETPLTFAAVWNQLPALKLLLEHGADPNIADRTGGTALMLAAQHGTASMVRELLRRKANPRAKDSAGHTALDHIDWRAADDEAREQIRRLIERSLGRSPEMITT